MQERLQKILAHAGIASRRAAEELVTAGRVRVNGRVVDELGAKADPYKDKIELDGKRIQLAEPVYLVLHKPRGVVSTLSDPEGRPTVAELCDRRMGRLYPVGRLDFATSGVLLMTNDGDFSQGLLHPRKEVPKTYVLKAAGLMTDRDLDRWRRGVDLEDGRTLPAKVTLLRYEDDKTWLEITITEGRNQQIRRMGDATGFRVMRLSRVSFAGITSDGLRPGESRPLTREELVDLRKQYGVPKRVRAAAQATVAPPRGRGQLRRGPPARPSGGDAPARRGPTGRPSRGDAVPRSVGEARPIGDATSRRRLPPPRPSESEATGRGRRGSHGTRGAPSGTKSPPGGRRPR